MQILSATHIPTNSAAINFFVTLVRDLQLISAITLIGLLVAIAFFLHEKKAVLSEEAIRVRTLASLVAAIWFLCSIGNVLLEISVLLAEPIQRSFDAVVIRSFLTQTALGQSYGIGLIAGLAAYALLLFIKKTTGAIATLAIVFIGLLSPVFQSHSSASGNHGVAIGSLLFHVTFISLWVGGVIGLIVIDPKEREAAIPRFSSLALWSAIIVTASGSINAWARLNFKSAWSSNYAYLVLVKIILTLILLGFGLMHRKYIAAKLHGSRAVYQLLIAEAFVMISTVAIGGWLATSQPPTSNVARSISPAVSLTGIEIPPDPTLWNLFWKYLPDGTFLGLLILATALYIKGVLVLNKRGDKWPVGRTVSFAIGIAIADFATSGGLGVYSHFSFAYHMVAHMVLGMVVPIFLILGAPITLALRALPGGRDNEERGIRGVLVQVMHSRYLQIISNPVIALAIFDGSLFLIYMTTIFGRLMNNHNGHLLMNVHFILAGALFFHVIVGVDPNPWKVPHIVRIIILFAAMSIHAFFSIALLSTTTQIDGGYFIMVQPSWIPDLLADQHRGASLGWALGEIPILLALVATFIQWIREDKKETKRIDRAEDRAAAMGEDDDLARYNKLLSELSRLDEKEKG